MGAGKTYLGYQLRNRLHIPFIEGDLIRNWAQLRYTREQKPFLYRSTVSAWKEFGERNDENIIKGLLAVRDTMSEFVMEELCLYHEHVIIDGAFLDPMKLKEKGKMFLIVQNDKSLHEKNTFEGKGRERNEKTIQEFVVARLIQEYLIEEAQKIQIPISDSKHFTSLSNSVL